ncbi:MAG: nitronate monooxygenase [Firmicutes bacterium]|nr:nitronate monooxygenase [Bacillota bacterium]
MIPTKLCSLLKIKYPIIQGGMAWIADAKLAAAVSNAGGLGLIAAMNSNGEQLRAEIKAIKKLTKKPYGVNIMLMSPYAKEAAQVVIEEKVPVITTGAGNPAIYMKDWIAAGIKVLPVVASTAHARMMAKSGATAVIAEGSEAGGHVGELSTMALLPQVVDCVDIPVVAAGGIADGRQAAATFVMGAQGLQIGTRFLVAKECGIHENYKKRVLMARDIDSIITGKRLGHPVRSIKSPFSRKMFEFEYDNTVSNEELEKKFGGCLRLAAVDGDEENGCFMAGQVAAMVKAEQTAAEIIKDIMDGAEQAIINYKL